MIVSGVFAAHVLSISWWIIECARILSISMCVFWSCSFGYSSTIYTVSNGGSHLKTHAWKNNIYPTWLCSNLKRRQLIRYSACKIDLAPNDLDKGAMHEFFILSFTATCFWVHVNPQVCMQIFFMGKWQHHSCSVFNKSEWVNHREACANRKFINGFKPNKAVDKSLSYSKPVRAHLR